MESRKAEFWSIVDSSFPEHAQDRAVYEQTKQRQIDQELRSEEARIAGKIGAANDDRVAAHFLEGAGDLESLIAQLQSEYSLSEQDALDAIGDGINIIRDVISIDYDDE